MTYRDFDPIPRLCHEIADLWSPADQRRILAHFETNGDLISCPWLDHLDREYLQAVVDSARPTADWGRPGKRRYHGVRFQIAAQVKQ